MAGGLSDFNPHPDIPWEHGSIHIQRWINCKTKLESVQEASVTPKLCQNSAFLSIIRAELAANSRFNLSPLTCMIGFHFRAPRVMEKAVGEGQHTDGCVWPGLSTSKGW